MHYMAPRVHTREPHSLSLHSGLDVTERPTEGAQTLAESCVKRPFALCTCTPLVVSQQPRVDALRGLKVPARTGAASRPRGRADPSGASDVRAWAARLRTRRNGVSLKVQHNGHACQTCPCIRHALVCKWQSPYHARKQQHLMHTFSPRTYSSRRSVADVALLMLRRCGQTHGKLQHLPQQRHSRCMQMSQLSHSSSTPSSPSSSGWGSKQTRQAR